MKAQESVVMCRVLKKELPLLKAPPFPGPLGEEIYRSVSAEAWGMWLSQQTMLINENHLNLSIEEDRQWMMAVMTHFLLDKS